MEKNLSSENLMSNQNAVPVFRQYAINSDEEIVISGVSGRFPNSHNIEEFKYNLYNKIDMCDDREVRFRHRPDIPKRMGKCYNLEKFDSSFFGIPNKVVNLMDPQSRCMLEHSVEALLDAGVCPQDIRGTNTGVYVGLMYQESAEGTGWQGGKEGAGIKDGYSIIGMSRGMTANRISYALDLKGPSFLTDSACSSSMTSLNCAYSAMRNGECDAAFVGGANTTLSPEIAYGFNRLGVTANNGYCRPFDENASGYTRSEAICIFFLQKRKHAKRVYATLIHSKINNDGFKEEGITYPAGHVQKRLLESFYHEINLDAGIVDYIEAHGTSTIVGDPEECKAIYQVFCKNRTKPILIGSVKSNMGHTEGASALCSLAKIVLALESGKIAPNINFTSFRKDIGALRDGHLKVVQEVTDLPGPLIACSSFGFGGSNGHILLKQHDKRKINYGIPVDGLPRLVCWTGRTEEACHTVFDDICKRPMDAEFIGLLHESQRHPIQNNLYKGYGIFVQQNDGSAVCITREVQRNADIQRPLVWVFSGMGSQWLQMGSSLMKLPMFRESIEKCHSILEKKDLNLIEILTSTDETILNNILYSFVGIAAIQIALVDILRALDIKPDYIIGHSVGELGCGYADGCLTAEEMILSSYSRGMVSLETKVVYGSMAAVGLGYQQIRSILPKGIEVACHNGSNSSTISGPAELVGPFVKQLTNSGVFAKEVACSNIPYHSSYIAAMGPKLLQRLRNIIKIPKQRSSKWLSTSVPVQNWSKSEVGMCSPEYHTNNLLNSVLFEETLTLLPDNAITLEIAPHSLLQAILKRSLPDGYHINLTQRGSDENLNVLFTGLGRLHTQKIHFPIGKLYPPIQFPVSVGTPMVSHLIRWEHSENFFVANFDETGKKSAEQIIMIDLSASEFKYIKGHVIDGRILFPATAYMHLVWNAFATMKNKYNAYYDTPVEFSDVKFLRATTFSKDTTSVIFKVVIHPSTGHFEVTESEAPVVTGCVEHLQRLKDVKVPANSTADILLKTNDFYKELKLRGYHYDGDFRSVIEARTDGSGGKIQWVDNFVPFIDCMLQLGIIGVDTRALMIPTGINRMKIDPKSFMSSILITNEAGHGIVDVTLSKAMKSLHATGIEIQGLSTSAIARRKSPGEPILQAYQFVPHHVTEMMRVETAVRVMTQLCLENSVDLKVNCLEVVAQNDTPIIGFVQEALEEIPKVTAELTLMTDNEDIAPMPGIAVELNQSVSKYKDLTIFIGTNYCCSTNKLESLKKNFREKAFVISKESKRSFDIKSIANGFELISVIHTSESILVLLNYNKKKKTEQTSTIVEVSNYDKSFNWINEVKLGLKKGKTYLVAYNDQLSGLMGLVNCLRKEPKSDAICVFIDDISAPAFNLELPFYKEQLQKGCAINVYRHGNWGSYRHLPIDVHVDLKPQTQHCYGNARRKGDLSSMTWYQGSLDSNMENIVSVRYSSLNFRDVMIASGKIDLSLMFPRIENENILGFEFSGILKNGRRVMGLCTSGCMATYVKPVPQLLWEVPDHWTLEEAATVPVVYSTVYTAFFSSANIQHGKKILIHAGTGGIGLSAIRVAIAYGLEVFTTVSTQEKREYLLSAFPELLASHIGNSRDTSFYQMIMLQTDGVGVDYVLNSLADDKLLASLDCLAYNGHFLEIGKYDILNNSKIGMRIFEKNTTLHSVMVDYSLKEKNIEMMEKIHKLVQADLDGGVIQPIRYTVFKASEMEDAFRYLAAAKHIGKVLLQIRENDFDQHSLPLRVMSKLHFKPDLVYLILGGLGGFGLELADWMIMRGCRKLVLSSRKGITKAYQAYRISIWQSYGAQIIISTDDITTPDGCMELMKTCIAVSPIGGIFNLAVLLYDSIFENQDSKKFTDCLEVKAYATKYLDELSRQFCPLLEHFVVFSSVSCGLGNAGQSNYGMANSIMERIIEKRVADGFPGKAIEWGAVGEVGLVAEMAENKIDLEIGGTLQQRISSCLETLDILLSCSEPVVSSMVVAEKKVLSGASILDIVLNIIGLKDIKSVSMDQKLMDSGMDSLMAVEIKETLEREYDLNLSPQDLRNLTFQMLIDLTKRSQIEDKPNTDDEAKSSTIALIFENLGDEVGSDEIFLPLNSIKPTTKHPILFIPGIEGVASKVWYDLGEKLTAPASILQIKNTKYAKSIQEITDMVIDDVTGYTEQYLKTFFIVGYSFGALITLELAKRLEQSGYKGKIVLIDGSPLSCQKTAEEVLSDPNMNIPKSHQVVLGSILLRSVAPNAPEDVMSKWNSWDDAVSSIYEISNGSIPYSKEYFKSVTEAALNRLKIALEINPSKFNKIASDIVLVRSVEPLVTDIEEDYELKRCTDGKVTVKFVDGNHLTMLKEDKLANIINEL